MKLKEKPMNETERIISDLREQSKQLKESIGLFRVAVEDSGRAFEALGHAIENIATSVQRNGIVRNGVNICEILEIRASINPLQTKYDKLDQTA